jgi:hypothetical protein
VTLRWARPAAIVLCGIILIALAVYIGWQLPHSEECNGGDACHKTIAIDWSRVDWGIPPERYACGVPHPGPDNVLIAPGGVCITADGVGNVLEKVTYEEMRTRAAWRRIITLVTIGLILVGTVVTAKAMARRKRASRGNGGEVQ